MTSYTLAQLPLAETVDGNSITYIDNGVADLKVTIDQLSKYINDKAEKPVTKSGFVEAALLGTAAIATKSPPVSRRLWFLGKRL